MPEEFYKCMSCPELRDGGHLYICDRTLLCQSIALCWPCMRLHLECVHDAPVKDYLD